MVFPERAPPASERGEKRGKGESSSDFSHPLQRLSSAPPAVSSSRPRPEPRKHSRAVAASSRAKRRATFGASKNRACDSTRRLQDTFRPVPKFADGGTCFPAASCAFLPKVRVFSFRPQLIREPVCSHASVVGRSSPRFALWVTRGKPSPTCALAIIPPCTSTFFSQLAGGISALLARSLRSLHSGGFPIHHASPFPRRDAGVSAAFLALSERKRECGLATVAGGRGGGRCRCAFPPPSTAAAVAAAEGVTLLCCAVGRNGASW